MTTKADHAYLFKTVSARTAAQKARANTCKHWGCTNEARYNARDCETCKARKLRISNPLREIFRNLKKSAKRRGIKFTLTFEQFKEFDRQTGLAKSYGKGRENMTVDRINPERGYEIDNIRALTYVENCRRRLNGVTDPAQPIAAEIARLEGHEIWQKCRGKANAILDLVELLLAQRDGGFQPSFADELEDAPF